jgi:Thermopsin/Periplasmic copper-binding protein (NosD)
MPKLPSVRVGVWVLPIVVVICALMVLPAGAVLQGAAASTAGPSSGALGSSTASSTVAAHSPGAPSSSAATPTGSSPAFASLSSIKGSTPEDQWLRSILSSQASSKGAPLVSLPNLAILENPTGTTGAQGVNPYYSGQPAPMGLADFGLGTSGPYSYNTTHINSQITFSSAPYATAPGSASVINPGGATQGYVGSPEEFSIQLNTVTINYTIPGSTDGTFWTQNVLDMNATGIHFVDDVFNLTGPVTAFEPGTIASGCGLTDLTNELTEYGGVYQCVGPTIPISSLGFPLTISLYNNATINTTSKQDVVSFGYRFSSPTNAFVAVTGWSDNVSFVNPNPSVVPASKLGYGIDGYTATPSGLLRDAEIIFGGPIGGTNAIFDSLNAAMNLYYSNASSGGWKSVPSAYDFGTDTGETSTGIAGYWTTSGTEEVNQGPSMLYGLWGALKWASVASGDIQFAGTISPDYGFVFVSNVAPGGLGANLSIVPTTDTGTFDSYLPATVPPGTQYYVRSYADGFVAQNTTPFSTSQTSYAITLNASMGTLNAPLYANGNAQESLLSTDIGLATAGDYNGLVVDLNLSFNHLNDYSFPSFALFQESGVTNTVTVNDTTQGPNSPLGTLYYYDNPRGVPSTGFLVPGASLNTTSRPNFSLAINSFDSGGLTVSNETLLGSTAYGTPFGTGGTIFLFDDAFVSVENIQTMDSSYGAFVGESGFVIGENVVAQSGSNGIDEVGDELSVVLNVSATGAGSFGIYALATGIDVTYEYINASDGAVGVYAGGYSVEPYYATPGLEYSTIRSVNATEDAIGVVLIDSYDNGVYYDTAATGALAFEGNYSSYDYFYYISAIDATAGFVLNDTHDSVYYLTITDAPGQPGSIDELSSWDSYYYTSVNGAGVGVGLYGTLGTYVEYVWDNASSVSAVEFDDGMNGEIEYLYVNASGTLGASIVDTVDFGGYYAYTTGPDTYGITGGWDIELDIGSYALATGVTVSGQGDVGIELADWDFATVTGTSATAGAEGVYLDDAYYVTVTGTGATGGSVGVLVEDSNWDLVADTTVYDYSTGVWAYDTYSVVINGVTATNSTLEPPFYYNYFNPSYSDAPIAAVYTDLTEQTSVENVAATNYPFAVYDDESTEGLMVNNVSSTGGYVAVALDDTDYAVINGVFATDNFEGLSAADADYNYITGSAFVDSTSYGVELDYCEENIVAGNSFIGNNGAGSTYNVVHIQAYATPGYYNYWYNPTTYTGNYWSDWNSDPSGTLAPYIITTDLRNVDYYPLNVPAGQTEVWFYAQGLASGTTWSMTFNGVTQSTTNSWLVFGAAAGANYTFTTGAVAGYSAVPATGTISLPAGTSSVSETVTFSALYTVIVTEKGLPKGTTWTATVAGVNVTGNTTTLMVGVPAGVFAFQVAASGYVAAPPNGTINVGASPTYNLYVTFSSGTSTSLVSTSTYNTGFAIAVAIAVIALLVGLLALFWRRRSKPSETPAPPTAWSPPAAAEGSSPPPATGSNTWSEGSGNPPS